MCRRPKGGAGARVAAPSFLLDPHALLNSLSSSFQALKAAGVTEVVLAINYQPKARERARQWGWSGVRARWPRPSNWALKTEEHTSTRARAPSRVLLAVPRQPHSFRAAPRAVRPFRPSSLRREASPAREDCGVRHARVAAAAALVTAGSSACSARPRERATHLSPFLSCSLLPSILRS